MKKYYLLFISLLAALFCDPVSLQASHAVSTSLTYTYVSPNKYKLNLKFYRDCSGISAPYSVYVNYKSSCSTGGSLTLPAIAGTGNEVKQACVTGVTTCNGGSVYGVEEWIYEGIVTLPMVCKDWVFSWETCCRNDNDVLVNAQSQGTYISAFLNSVEAPTNSSASFLNVPLPSFCVNKMFLIYF